MEAASSLPRAQRIGKETRPLVAAVPTSHEKEKTVKKIVALLSLAALVLGAAGALMASSTIYGVSGLFEVPDDSIASQNSVALTAKRIYDVDDSDSEVSFYGGAVGIAPKVEIGGTIADSSAAATDSEGIIGGKLRLVEEALDKPSVTVGVVDAGSRLKRISGTDEDASAFVVFGKNLSAAAEGFSGMVSKPVRGFVGWGTGIYRGGFAGLSLSLAPKVDVIAEWLGKGVRDDSTVTGGVRFGIVKGLNVEASYYRFKDFTIGANYTLGMY